MSTPSLFVIILFSILGNLCKRIPSIELIIFIILACLVTIIIFKIKIAFIAVLFFAYFFLMTPSIINMDETNVEINDNFEIFEKGSRFYLVKNGQDRYLIYLEEDLEVGDFLHLKGNTEDIATFSIPNLSTFKDYLRHKQVYKQVDIQYYALLNRFNLRKWIKNQALSHLSLVSQNFIRLIVFGDKTQNLELYEELKELSVIQLFVISGFHINILYNCMYKLFLKKSIPALIVICFYVYVLNFPIPALRACFLLFLGAINKKIFHDKMSRFQLWGITLLMLLFINPLSLYNLSFQLTVMASLALLSIGSFSFKPIKLLLTSLFVYLFLLPILINMNFEINVWSFLFNIILSLPISILYIGSIGVSILKFMDIFYIGLVISLQSVIETIQTVNFVIIVGKISNITILVYYSSLLALLYTRQIKYKKGFINSTLCVTMVCCFIYFDKLLYSPFSLTFIDVGQGDAILIQGANSKYNILVDTGGSQFSDIGKRRIIPYLKSLGIESLDAIIITHNDFDHMGALDTIVANYRVDKVFRSDFNSYETDGLSIINLNHYQDSARDDNYNCHVLLVKYLDRQYLLMGDAPQEIEKRIIADYQFEEIEILKIGHHGSKTSTSEEFLIYIKPKIVVISVGAHNPYRHPNNEVIALLEKHNIPYYRTDMDGSIVVKKINYLMNYIKKWNQIIYNIVTKWR